MVVAAPGTVPSVAKNVVVVPTPQEFTAKTLIEPADVPTVGLNVDVELVPDHPVPATVQLNAVAPVAVAV